MKTKIWNAFVIALMLLQAVTPITALAMTTTDREDYAPGEIVTISGDNSDRVGYLPDETVRVDVTGPNSYTGFCEAVVNAEGYWACQVILPNDAAAGNYVYVATGLTSAVSQSGGFNIPAPLR